MKPFFSILISVVSLFLILNFSRELINLSQAGNRLEEIREDVKKLRFKNWQLKQEVDYRKTDEFLEKEIRDKLGMARKGETVVILPQEKIEKIASQAAAEKKERQLSIWRQWLELFL